MYCHGHPEMFQDILLYQYWLHILLSLSMYTTHCFLALHVFILFPGQWTHFCRQKKKRYIVITFGPKSNLSVISPAKRSRSGPNSVYVDMSRADNVQRILGAIGPLCAKWGLGQVQSFFVWLSRGVFGNFATADLIQIWSRNVVRCPAEEYGKIFLKFTLGVICPKNLKSVKQAPHSELATGHGMHCRDTVYSTL